MKASILLRLLFGLALTGGCASKPANLVRVAIVENQAEARYAFEGPARFPVASAAAARIQIYTPKPAETERREKGTSDQIVQKPGEKESIHAPQRVETSLIPRSKSTSEKANTDAREAKGDVTENAQGPSEKSRIEKPNVLARTDTATKNQTILENQIGDRAVSSSTDQKVLAAQESDLNRRPSLRKRVTKSQALVGEPFAYILELENTTPLDLSSVEVTDLISPDLTLDLPRVRVEAPGKPTISFKDRQFQVLIPGGVKRRNLVRVVLPVTYPIARHQ